MPNNVDIRFETIRLLGTNQEGAFEELITQLARDTAEDGETFNAKGKGADGGIECFLTAAGGEETGWQAKFVFTWKGAAPQLTKSFNRCLDAHPNIRKFVACIPFTLADGRKKNQKSAREKYEAWKADRLKDAKKCGRAIEIELWDASVIRERLLRGPHAAARLTYWFDKTLLTTEHMRRLFNRTSSALGSRYVADDHVSLDIEEFALDLSRRERWRARIAAHLEAISGQLAELSEPNPSSTDEPITPILTSPLNVAVTQLDNIQQTWASWCDDPSSSPPFAQMTAGLADLLEVVDTAIFGKDRDAPIKTAIELSPRTRQTRIQFFDAVSALIRRLERFVQNGAPILGILLDGEGGMGKSHLLARIVERKIDEGGVAILILGGSLAGDGPPWRSVVQAVDDSRLADTDSLLGALNEAAACHGEKALICIDALNEGHGDRLWPEGIGRFLARAAEYPNIALILSCRTPMLDVVLPDGLPSTLLPVTHRGYAGTGGAAAIAYINSRGLTRSRLARPGPELDNPLLLKLVCDALINEGKTHFPDDLDHVTRLFAYTLVAAYRDIDKRLGLDRRLGLPRRGMREFALAAMQRHGWLRFDEANSLLDQVLPSRGRRADSLLTAFIEAGILTSEADGYGSNTEHYVRFTFERFGDFICADAIVDRGLTPSEVVKKGSMLQSLLSGETTLSAGVYNAILLILADQKGLEVSDLDADALGNRRWQSAFRSSLRRRGPDAMSDRTVALAITCLSDQELMEIATSRIGLGAKWLGVAWLDQHLRDATLVERDLTWSRYLLSDGSSLQVSVLDLVTWIETNDLDGMRAAVLNDLALLLAWCFTTPHREVRDRATKALVKVLSPDLSRGSALLETFSDMSDLYVLERILASLYGAALQNDDPDGVARLAEAVHRHVFSGNAPPNNILLRDHAVSLLEFASETGVYTPDPSAFRGPYRDGGQLEYVARDWTPDGATVEDWRDAVLSSVGEMGDFGRYIIQPFVANWSPAHRSVSRLPQSVDVFGAWLTEFEESQPDHIGAWQALDDFVSDWNAKGRPDDLRLDDDWKAALSTFRSAIGETAYLDFEQRGQGHLRYYRHRTDFTPNSPDSFDLGWAQRWIWKRVHDMGWSVDGFADAERGLGGYRTDHRRERFGKKYQWLAFYELAARLQDHYAYGVQQWGVAKKFPIPFVMGPNSDRIRNIDPSLLRGETYYEGWVNDRETWWTPRIPDLALLPPRGQLDWLHGPDDLIAGDDLIAVTDPQDGSEWLVLHSFVRKTASQDNSTIGLETWCRIDCYVVPKENLDHAKEFLSKHILINPSEPFQAHIPYWTYLGEVGWTPSLAEEGIYSDPWRYEGLGDIRATTVEYLRESSGYDYSIRSNIGLQLPLPWLSTFLEARLSDGVSLTHVDKDGQILFLDPSAHADGPSACLVSAKVFLNRLESAGLAPIWIQAGEKAAFGKDCWGGRLSFTQVHILKDNTWDVAEITELEKPTPEKLQDFVGEDDELSEAELAKWTKSVSTLADRIESLEGLGKKQIDAMRDALQMLGKK